MKWIEAEKKPKKRSPAGGSVRHKKHFLWKKKTIKGETRWLEIGEYVQCYDALGWVDLDWEDTYQSEYRCRWDFSASDR